MVRFRTDDFAVVLPICLHMFVHSSHSLCVWLIRRTQIPRRLYWEMVIDFSTLSELSRERIRA